MLEINFNNFFFFVFSHFYLIPIIHNFFSLPPTIDQWTYKLLTFRLPSYLFILIVHNICGKLLRNSSGSRSTPRKNYQNVLFHQKFYLICWEFRQRILTLGTSFIIMYLLLEKYNLLYVKARDHHYTVLFCIIQSCSSFGVRIVFSLNYFLRWLTENDTIYDQ